MISKALTLRCRVPAFVRVLTLAFVAVAAAACSRDIAVGTFEQEATSAEDATAAYECEPVRCRGPLLECGDCEDNDGDGLVDSADPDCFSPCSNSELNLAGRKQPCTNDSCFFAADCGIGNDQNCLELTPNGCDCRGCCEFEGSNVLLGSMDDTGTFTCDSTSLADPSRCLPCEPDPQCINPCEACEVCFARETSLEGCETVGTCVLPICPNDLQPCAPECGVGCDPGFACITGCCVNLQ